MEKFYKKRSLVSASIHFFQRFLPLRYNTSTIERAERINKIIKPWMQVPFRSSLYLKHHFKKSVYNGINIYNAEGNFNNLKDKVIVYLNGGGYFVGPLRPQISTAMRLAKVIDATLFIVQYPLAPEYTLKDLYPGLIAFYNILKDKIGDKELIFLGDSAGGALVLGFSMFIKEQRLGKGPDHIILFSPWLDQTMSNPKLKRNIKTETLLGYEGLPVFAKAWAGHLSLNDYRVSPIYGNQEGLGKITLVGGNYEIFYEDIKRYHEILLEKDIKHNYIIYNKEAHIFMLFKTREQKNLMRELQAIICPDLVLSKKSKT